MLHHVMSSRSTALAGVLALLISLVSSGMAADGNLAGDWQSWSPRQEIAPKFARNGDMLEISSTGNSAIYGAWRKRFDGLKPGTHYRLIAHYRATGLSDAPFNSPARLQWLDADGNNVNGATYAGETRRDGDWTRVELLAPSPAKAAGAVIELGLRWSATGSVAWKDVTVTEESAPAQRLVRVATVGLRPQGTGSAEATTAKFCEAVRAMKGETDLIVLPEAASMIGSGKMYLDVAEPIPGPLSNSFAEVAKEKRSYMVVGLFEREGQLVYNTAVLFDRQGRIVGKYRKTHLPQGEAAAGLTPGNEFPVFDTDFGKLGMLICWDVEFPEPWRILGQKQAEIIALPIWGGNETLAKARAIENHIYLVTASYDMKTFVVDPTGDVIAEAKPKANQPIARTTIDLNKIFLQPWVGDMKNTTWKDRRTDLAPVQAGR